ncbi:20626_t:CDS:2 [Funneliformis geosporum]|nr:20626_t:CDS:2 [Funneliformis geosporum]
MDNQDFDNVISIQDYEEDFQDDDKIKNNDFDSNIQKELTILRSKK